jgi:polar amino acid transport system permease protein
VGKHWYHCFLRENTREAPPRCPAYLLNALLVGGALLFLFAFAFSRLEYDFHWHGVWAYRSKFLQGLGMTLVISFFSLFVSFILGLLFALGEKSRILPLYLLSRYYVEIIRGTPLLVQILVFFYVIANAFHVHNRYVTGVMILSLFAGAYISEIIRAGIDSIGQTQWETGRSLGLTRFQIYRFIIFPQVFKRILPPLAGQLVSLIKDSSLLSIISVSEFTLNAQEVNAYTYSTLESYIPLAVGYLVITYPISHWSKKLEKTFAYET